MSDNVREAEFGKVNGVPDVWNGPCTICGAVAWGRWPHPEGEGCPERTKVGEEEERRRNELNDASIAAQLAMKDYYDTLPRKLKLFG